MDMERAFFWTMFVISCLAAFVSCIDTRKDKNKKSVGTPAYPIAAIIHTLLAAWAAYLLWLY